MVTLDVELLGNLYINFHKVHRGYYHIFLVYTCLPKISCKLFRLLVELLSSLISIFMESIEVIAIVFTINSLYLFV